MAISHFQNFQQTPDGKDDSTFFPDWTSTANKEVENQREGDDDKISCKRDDICIDNGANTDPADCSKFYSCFCGMDGEWIKISQACPQDHLFNQKYSSCDFPVNVDCKANLSESRMAQAFVGTDDINEEILAPGHTTDGNQASKILPNSLYLIFLVYVITNVL